MVSNLDIEKHNKEKQKREQNYNVAAPAKYQCLQCNGWYNTGYNESFCSEKCCVIWMDEFEDYYLGEK